MASFIHTFILFLCPNVLLPSVFVLLSLLHLSYHFIHILIPLSPPSFILFPHICILSLSFKLDECPKTLTNIFLNVYFHQPFPYTPANLSLNRSSDHNLALPFLLSFLISLSFPSPPIPSACYHYHAHPALSPSSPWSLIPLCFMGAHFITAPIINDYLAAIILRCNEKLTVINHQTASAYQFLCCAAAAPIQHEVTTFYS